ncbi:flagellar motor protein MotB [Pedobacter hiemivivus]|uniref:Flagellar motor protein MotB n=1 Tax=Pedobacter hiemivivus TaxID=2530454 RepID=A0A4U1G3N9_9SPHI|nr:OmpA family protein [Pedobacter hiemivivus]TKC57210.1 flagellar motor protein MotB [Pedobacter hiemivivus]
MLSIYKNLNKVLICLLAITFVATNASAQTEKPKWSFGVSGAANGNFFDGTTQTLNNSLMVPTAFHKGKGIRPFGSILAEYQPSSKWGIALNFGYDGRGGKFDGVIAPCNCPADLKTNVSYLTVEPSLKFSPGGGNFYLFAGPRVAMNLQKDFNYTQLKQPNTNAEFSEVRKTLISAQVGIGYDIPVSAPESNTRFVISPFVSYHPYFGQDVREIESWSITTVRAGVALKFGKARKVARTSEPAPVAPVQEVSFSVRAPKEFLVKNAVSETLPLLNYVFFDEGSTALPGRYTLLSKNQAVDFKESQLQNEVVADMSGRSVRQLSVYYNILNIVGARMKANPEISITLSGASKAGPDEGRKFAAAVKNYLTTVFEIPESKIAINGRTKPVDPSEQPGGTKELELLRAGDRRVDIQSTSDKLMMEIGGGMMKPVQINTTQADPMDSHVVFNINRATELLKSYTIDLTDQQGKVQHFGPFTKNQESIAAQRILGTNEKGVYKVVMLGETKEGTITQKESSVQLQSQQEILQTGLRYSVLFNFNKANTAAAYEQFLTEVVAPLISNGSAITIHGYTDIIGSEDYNSKLSQKRAEQAQHILEHASTKAGKSNLRFQTLGSGEDSAPFNNNLPEERFYNRTVIIDIISK